MTGGPRPPVVLLGGEGVALAVARSLEPAGIEVIALGHGADPVRRSRHCRRFVELTAPEDWDRWLLTEAPPGAVVLPCCDGALELLARRRTALTERGLVPMEAQDEALLAMLDKEATYRIAREADVPAPRTRPVESAADVRAAAAEIGWPVALKPAQSHRFAAHYGLTRKVLLADDVDGLVSLFVEASAKGIDMLVTEIVPGREDAFCSYYTYLDARGEPLFHYTKRKLRQYPPYFGLGTYHVSEWQPDVAEAGLRFLRAAGVRGLACVEFKRDGRDGRLRLIECNHRFTLATELLRHSGVNVARFVYEHLTGGAPASLGTGRDGTSLWTPLRDARAFLGYRREGELTFGAWVRTLLRRQHFPVAALSDPLPGAVGAGRTLRRAAGRLRRRRGRARLAAPAG